jgi:hypothetical protein
MYRKTVGDSLVKATTIGAYKENYLRIIDIHNNCCSQIMQKAEMALLVYLEGSIRALRFSLS